MNNFFFLGRLGSIDGSGDDVINDLLVNFRRAFKSIVVLSYSGPIRANISRQFGVDVDHLLESR